MDKTNDSAVLSLRLQGAVLAELTERAQYAGKTRSRFARELIMKSLAVPAPARTIFRTADEEELTKPHALKLLLKDSENAALMRIAAVQGVSRQQLVIGLIRMAAASEAQLFRNAFFAVMVFVVQIGARTSRMSSTVIALIPMSPRRGSTCLARRLDVA